MSNGRHAAPDNSFNRSAGGAVLRGAVLMLVALVVGIVLLQSTDNTKSQAGPSVPDSSLAASDTTIAGGVTPLASTTTVVRRAPNVVKVLIVNGSGKNRAGARVKAFLLSSGYDFLVPRDANAANYADRVSYTPGYEAEAAAIGALLGLTPDMIGPLPTQVTVRTPPAAPEFNVQIMVGGNLAAKTASQPLTGATATTTTVAGVATSVAPA